MTTLTALPNSRDSDALLASAARLVRAAIGLFGESREPGWAEMEHVGECVGVAVERLTTWLEDARTDNDERKPDVFDAIEGCIAASAMIDAGLNPRHQMSISPIRGTLKLAADRLDDLLAADSDQEPDSQDSEDPTGEATAAGSGDEEKIAEAA